MLTCPLFRLRGRFRLAVLAATLFIPQIAAAEKVPTMQADFDHAPVADVLQHIGRVGRVNIVTSDRVKGTVTMRLGRDRWDHVLVYVLRAKGLGMERNDNVIWIDTLEGLRDAREHKKKVRELGDDLSPMVILILPLSYARAENMAPIVQSYLSPDGSVSVDERTNSLIIRDHAARVRHVQDLAREVVF